MGNGRHTHKFESTAKQSATQEDINSSHSSEIHYLWPVALPHWTIVLFCFFFMFYYFHLEIMQVKPISVPSIYKCPVIQLILLRNRRWKLEADIYLEAKFTKNLVIWIFITKDVTHGGLPRSNLFWSLIWNGSPS